MDGTFWHLAFLSSLTVLVAGLNADGNKLAGYIVWLIGMAMLWYLLKG
jgi:hypothetical protein